MPAHARIGAFPRRARIAAWLIVAASALAIPAGAQAWTVGTTNTGTLSLSNDVPGDGDFYDIGFVPGSPGLYEIGAITADAHVFGNCTVTAQLSVVHCSPTGITHIDVTGEFRDADVFHFDTAANGTSAPIPHGVTTEVRTFKGADSVSGSHNHDVLLGGGGNDTLHGGGGNDRIVGGNGKDSLFGDAGRDLLEAEDGTADLVIDCGANADQPALFDMGLDPAPISC